MFQSSLPNMGIGSLTTRDEVSLYGTDKEKTLFRTQDTSWSDLAEEFSDAGVGVNLFLFPSHYIDIASIGTSSCHKPIQSVCLIYSALLGTVAYTSGGDVFYHPRFDFERDSRILLSELTRVVSRETAYNATIRVRVSSGVSHSRCCCIGIDSFVSRPRSSRGILPGQLFC